MVTRTISYLGKKKKREKKRECLPKSSVQNLKETSLRKHRIRQTTPPKKPINEFVLLILQGQILSGLKDVNMTTQRRDN